MDLVHIDYELLDGTATLDAGVLGVLDAMHLAPALVFGDELSTVVTYYDERMARLASRLGLSVAAPR